MFGLPARSARSAPTPLWELSTPEVTEKGLPFCNVKMPVVCQPPARFLTRALLFDSLGSCQINEATNDCGIAKSESPRLEARLNGLKGLAVSEDPLSRDLLQV